MRAAIVTIILCLHLLAPIAAWAQSRNPLDTPLKLYGLMLGAALLGGFVSWYGKVKKGLIPGYSVFHLVGELATSALAGLVCFWVCEAFGAPLMMTAAGAGVCGHMGTRAIAFFEDAMAKRAKRVLGTEP